MKKTRGDEDKIENKSTEQKEKNSRHIKTKSRTR